MDAGAYAGETPAIAGVAMLTVGVHLPGRRRPLPRPCRLHEHSADRLLPRRVRAVHGLRHERHMDRIARALGIDRRALRVRNVYRPGDRMPNGQELRDTAFAEAFERVEAVAPWAEVSARGRTTASAIAAVTWLTNPLAGSATLKLNEDGTVGLITAATDIGTGAVYDGTRPDRGVGAGHRARRTSCSTRPTRTPPPTTPAPRAAAPSTTSATRSSVPPARCADRSSSAPSDLLEAAEQDLDWSTATSRWSARRAPGIPLADVAAAALGEAGPIAATGSAVSLPVAVDHAHDAWRLLPSLQRAHVPRAPGRGRGRPGDRPRDDSALRRRPGRRARDQPDRHRGPDPRRCRAGDRLRAVRGHPSRGRPCPREQPRELPAARARSTSRRSKPSCSNTPIPHGPFGAKGAGEPPIVPVAAVIANAVSDAIGRPIDRLPITPFAVLAALARRTRTRGPCRQSDWSH